MEELNELKEKVGRLSAAAKEEYDSAAAKLESYFKSLLKDFRVRVGVDLGASEYRFAIDLLKDDDTEYFGAGFTLRYGRKYDFDTREFGLYRRREAGPLPEIPERQHRLLAPRRRVRQRQDRRRQG